MGDALFAKEPFIGITRVKFENLIQDYSDNLVDARIKPAEAKPATEKPSAAKAAPAPAKPSKTKTSTAKAPETKPKS